MNTECKNCEFHIWALEQYEKKLDFYRTMIKTLEQRVRDLECELIAEKNKKKNDDGVDYAGQMMKKLKEINEPYAQHFIKIEIDDY